MKFWRIVCKISSNLRIRMPSNSLFNNIMWLFSLISLVIFSAAQEDLASFAKKGYLLCQILHGAISSQANPDFTLNSLPVMYANNWIKSIFKIMAAITQDLAKYLFSRNSKSFDAPIFSAEVFDNMVCHESFFRFLCE